MPGYSGTPLAQKLGIKLGQRVATIGAPAGYRKLLAPLPKGVLFTTGIEADDSAGKSRVAIYQADSATV